MLAVTMFAFSIFPLLLLELFKSRQPINKPVLGFALIYFAVLVFNFFVSHSNFSQQLYGVYGRNVGLLTQISFLIIFLYIASTNFNRETLLNFIFNASYICLILSIIFGFIQVFTLDGEYLLSGPSKFTAFYGNGNFFSSILGILVAFPLMNCWISKSRILLISNLNLILATLYLIFRIGDLQGFFILAILIFSIITITIYKTNRSLSIIFLIAGSMIGSFVLIGTFGKGPLGKLLVQQSNLFRLDYFRSALNVGKSNFFTGAGIESFIDTYTQGRDVNAFNRRSSVLVDSPHNHLLNQFVNGGILLLTLSVILFIAVFYKIYKSIKILHIKDKRFLTIVLVWISIFSSLMINPSNISILLWFWILSGVILNTSFGGSKEEEQLLPNRNAKNVPKSLYKIGMSKFILFTIFGAVVGATFAFPEFRADTQLRQGLDTGNQEKLTSAAIEGPYQQTRAILVAKVFFDNALESEGVKILKDAANKNNDCLRCWQLLLEHEKDPKIVLKIKNEMHRLDPLGNTE